jgi:predicted nuclease with TOPRIM domain
VAELKAELREAKDDAKENWFVFKQRSEDLIEYKARFDEEVRGGIELQDRLDAKDKELEQTKEQIKKCHERLSKWGEILGVIKFSMRDVDKA